MTLNQFSIKKDAPFENLQREFQQLEKIYQYIMKYEDQEKLYKNQIKGYCDINNLYYAQFQNLQSSSDKCLYYAYLTNYKNQIQLYFDSVDELKIFRQNISRYIIKYDIQQKYVMNRKLGEGSFSEVYYATNRFNQDIFAIKKIKKIRKDYQNDKQAIKRQKITFIQMADYNPQTTTKLYQSYEDQNFFYLVLQYYQGTNLTQFLKQNYKFPYIIRKIIIKNILLNLFSIHQKGFVHRDIKPYNIMIDKKTFKTKIIDFGLCINQRSKQDIKYFNKCGTIGYMAPQILSKQRSQTIFYTSKCDMFSFGIVCHIILFGNNPLKGENYNQTLTNNKEGRIELDKVLIRKKYGETGLIFLNGLLEIDIKKRLSAKSALQCEFLNDEYLQQMRYGNEEEINIIEQTSSSSCYNTKCV